MRTWLSDVWYLVKLILTVLTAVAVVVVIVGIVALFVTLWIQSASGRLDA